MTSVKEFKKRVTEKLLNINNEIKEEDLYFDQSADLYTIEYKPDYPNKSNGDFMICQQIFNEKGKVSVYGNYSALIFPTIRHFKNLDDFEENL